MPRVRVVLDRIAEAFRRAANDAHPAPEPHTSYADAAD